MSEKHLTELPWKALARQKKITKDAGLGKALASFDSTAESDQATRLTAIEEIKTVAKKLLKEHEDDKEIEEYLDEVLLQAEKARKTAEMKQQGAAQEKDEKEEEEGEDEEEAEEYKKDLGTKLKSALSQVKSRAPGEAAPGAEALPPLRFMAFVAANSCAVLVARKVGNAAKKLLPEIAGASGGGKFFKGECLFEKNVHTFVLEQVPAGLARKLATALLTETGMKYQVRVRSTDGSVDLDSDTDTDPDEIPAAPPPAPAPGTDPMVKFTARLKALIPAIKANPQVKAFPGTPEEKGLNVVASEAGELAKKKDFDKAHELLDVVESALKNAGGGSASSPGAAFNTGQWQAARQAWQAAIELVDGQLDKLGAALQQQQDEELQEIAEYGLNAVTGDHKVPLMAAIMDVDSTNDAGRAGAARKALPLVLSFQKHLESDARVAACDENPFGVPVTIRSTLGGALADLSKVLAAA